MPNEGYRRRPLYIHIILHRCLLNHCTLLHDRINTIRIKLLNSVLEFRIAQIHDVLRWLF